jgi:hypothetical protein
MKTLTNIIHPAFAVLLALRVNLALRVHKGPLVLTAHPARKALQGRLGHLAHKARLVRSARLVHRGQLESGLSKAVFSK